MASARAVVTRFGRAYRIAGVQRAGGFPTNMLFPSVTSILNVIEKSFLVKWAVRMSLDLVRNELNERQSKEGQPPAPGDTDWIDPMMQRAAGAAEAYRQSAADFGTRAHAAIDEIVKGNDPVLTEDIAPVVRGFKAWYSASGITLHLAGDLPVYSRRYKYAGAADCLGRTSDGRLVVLDFKTSNSIHSSYAMQLAAYANAVGEMWQDGELDIDALYGGDAHAAVLSRNSSSSNSGGWGNGGEADPTFSGDDSGSSLEGGLGLSFDTLTDVDSAGFGSFSVAADPPPASWAMRSSSSSSSASASSAAVAEGAVGEGGARKPTKPRGSTGGKSSRAGSLKQPANEAMMANPIVDDAWLSQASVHLLSQAAAAAPKPVKAPVASDTGSGGACSPALVSAVADAAAADALNVGEAVEGGAPSAGRLSTPRAAPSRSYSTTATAQHQQQPQFPVGASAAALPQRNASDLRIIALVVRLDKATGAAEVKQVVDLNASFSAFKAALLLWHATQTKLLEDVAVAPAHEA